MLLYSGIAGAVYADAACVVAIHGGAGAVYADAACVVDVCCCWSP